MDLTVRGAGIFGLSVAFVAARQGARVRVVDSSGVAAGASGGIVGALAPHTPENWNPKKAFQFESLVLAEAFWADVDELSGQASGYARLGRLQPILDARALGFAEARAKGAETYWRDYRWQVVDAEGSWVPSAPTGQCVFDDFTARLHPRRACLSLAGALEALGGEIVREAEDSGSVLWATGATGLAALSTALEQPVGSAVKGQAALLRHEAGDAPQIFADGLHIVPHDDGTVAIGSTSERDFTDPAGTDAQLDVLIDKARALCPALVAAPVIARWAGLRPRARSRAPMLGAWPGRPGHFIANGGFKIGFGIAPKAAQVMAALILEERDQIPDGFRVEDNLR